MWVGCGCKTHIVGCFGPDGDMRVHNNVVVWVQKGTGGKADLGCETLAFQGPVAGRQHADFNTQGI